MSADVQKITGQMIVIDPVVTERVSPQLGRRDKHPVGDDAFGRDLGRKQGCHVPLRFGDVFGQGLLALPKRFERFVTFQQMDVASRVMSDSSD